MTIESIELGFSDDLNALITQCHVEAFEDVRGYRLAIYAPNHLLDELRTYKAKIQAEADARSQQQSQPRVLVLVESASEVLRVMAAQGEEYCQQHPRLWAGLQLVLSPQGEDR